MGIEVPVQDFSCGQYPYIVSKRHGVTKPAATVRPDDYLLHRRILERDSRSELEALPVVPVRPESDYGSELLSRMEGIFPEDAGIKAKLSRLLQN